MSNITIELCKEDRQRLDEVIAFLGLIVGELKSRPTEIQGELLQAEVSIGLPVEGAAHLEPVEETPAPVEEPAAPEVPPVSFPEFQKAVTQAVAKGPEQKAAVKEIINKYAASVSAVPEEKRAEVMAELAKI